MSGFLGFESRFYAFENHFRHLEEEAILGVNFVPLGVVFGPLEIGFRFCNRFGIHDVNAGLLFQIFACQF